MGLSLGTSFPLCLTGFNELPADEFSAQTNCRTTAYSRWMRGECAKSGPSREVKVSLPSAVVGALENAARVFGISLETLVARTVKSDGRVGEEGSETDMSPGPG